MSTELGRQATPQEIAAVEAQAAADLEKTWADLPDDNPDAALRNSRLPPAEKVDHEITSQEPAVDDKDSPVKGDAPPADKQPDQQQVEQAEQQAPDIWANATPEQLAERDALRAAKVKAENDSRAHAGRVRKMLKQHETLSSAKGADKTNIADTLKEAAADFPEIAKPVAAAFEKIEKRLERSDQSGVQRQEVEDHVQSQEEILAGVHPDWNKKPYITNVEANRNFLLWVNDQPAGFRDIVFNSNRERIFDGNGAAQVFTAYEAHLAATANPKPATVQQQPAVTTQQELNQKRVAQRQALDTPKVTTSTPVKSGTPKDVEDPAAHWNELPDDNPDEGLIRRRA